MMSNVTRPSVANLVLASSFICITILSACTDSSDAPPEPYVDAQGETQEWLAHGRTNSEQRFSPLDEINLSNINNLSLAWYYDLRDHNVVEATPIVANGQMFVTGAMGIVYALDSQTGAELWIHDPEVPPETLVRACCQPVNRGVALADGKVFVGSLDGRLIALNAKTGAVEWEVVTTDSEKPFTITGAPRIVKDTVVIGNAGAEYGVRGYVSAYKIADGEMAWRFYTIPGDPSLGFEDEAMERAAETWTGEWWKFGGGGTVWDAIVYDPDLNLVYIGTGNGTPWNHAVRSPEGGDNLYLSSIVALNADTGEYVWHYQTTPAETWDYTATQPIMLAELEIRGETRKVLMQAPKNGIFYVLDRTNGEFISGAPFSQVNWATGFDPVSGRPIENPATRPTGNERVFVQPGPSGAHNWNPMAYSPDTGLVYVPTLDSRFFWQNDPNFEFADGYWNLAYDLSIPMDFSTIGEEQRSTSYLLAWDPVTQEEAWRADGSGGGLLATAGGLVFRGEVTGEFSAYNAATGEKVWSSAVQNSGVAGPVTYAVDGEQIVAIALGRGAATMQKGAVPYPANVPHANRVVAFKLGGTASLPPYEYTPPELRAAPIEKVDVESAALGRSVFHRFCFGCHGREARGNRIQPDLRFSDYLDNGLWDEVVLEGVLQGVGMVSFSDVLDAELSEALRQYVILEAQKPGARALGQSGAPVQ
jgi:quinohemoprotein ethanol dehydrogenase